jgi:hypothetical protein
MMTGQMIAGADPSQAARYQMIVMFLVSSATASAATSTVLLASATLVDKTGRVRRDLLSRRTPGGARRKGAAKRASLLWRRMKERWAAPRAERGEGAAVSAAAGEAGREPLLAAVS